MAQRMAGEPGTIGKIAGFLSDNPLTRSWATTMDRHVITPVEARLMGRDRLMREESGKSPIAVTISERLPESGELTPEIIKAMSKVKGSEINADVLTSEIMGSSQPPKIALEGLIAGSLGTWQPKMQNIVEAAQAVADGRVGLSRAGDYVRQYGLGSPVAAYSAVTAGGALATQAGMDAYDWWMAQQQQAVKDSQLPLSAEDQAVA